MRINIISCVALAATVSGLVITSPRIGEKIDPERPLTIKWKAVETDPETFSIEMVNQNVYPPTTEVVAQDVDRDAGSYTVDSKAFPNVDNGKGYQINMISPGNGILAQSQQFRVTEPGALSSSSGKETSTASQSSSIESSMLSSTSASTSDITSSTASSMSLTATHSSSVSTPSSTSSVTLSSSLSTPSSSSMMSSSSKMTTKTSTSTESSTSMSTSTDSTTSTTTHSTTSTKTSTSTESASTTANAGAVLMPPAGSLLLGLFALAL